MPDAARSAHGEDVDGTVFVWAALAVWLVGGLVGYLYLRRHAHPHPGWLLASLLLGPFAVMVFADRVETSSHVLVRQPATDVTGMTVLVGLDGSADADHALDVARRMVHSQQCCLVLCEVIDYDSEDDPQQTATEAARARLTRAAAGMPDEPCTIEVVAGPPAQALNEAAERHDADVVVVGTRGRGLSRRLLGSVAEDLLATATRPVLVTHRQDYPARSSTVGSGSEGLKPNTTP